MATILCPNAPSTCEDSALRNTTVESADTYPFPEPSPSGGCVSATVTGEVYPSDAGTILGLGTYPCNTNAILTFVPGIIPPEYAYADIMFIVDESGSMATEHAWLTTMPATLEAALQAAGIGSSSPENQYALVGFGAQAHSSHGPHKHTVGGGDWGTAAELCTAATTLVTNGWIEDGYHAMNYGLNNYTWRTDAAKIIVLITDEDRDNAYPSVTKASITAELLAAGIVCAFVVNLDIVDTESQACIGRMDATTFRGIGSPPYYAISTLFSINPGPDPAASDTVTDYCEVAEACGGSEWDLNMLRAGGADAVSFGAAFVDILKEQIIAELSYIFDHWEIGGVTYTDNPVTFFMNRDVVAKVYANLTS